MKGERERKHISAVNTPESSHFSSTKVLPNSVKLIDKRSN